MMPLAFSICKDQCCRVMHEIFFASFLPALIPVCLNSASAMNLFMHFRFLLCCSLMESAIGMFHKRSRESSNETPGAERWRHHMEELFLSNQVSAPEIRDMFEDGTVMRVQHTRKFAKAGKYGKFQNNVKRDMLRAAMKDKKDWPPLYYIEVEVVNPATQTVGLKKLPIILPHEFIFFLQHKNESALLLSQENMGQATKVHMANACQELGVSELLGIGLWGDGVPCKFDRSESLEVLTMNIPGVSTAKELRVPVTVINKKFVVKALTFDSIFSVLAWSFSVLASGVMPSHDHLGVPFTGKRAKYAGKFVLRSVLCEFRGDWAWYKQCFRFPQHNENRGICWRCSCTPSEIRQVGSDARWRSQKLTHWQLLQRMFEQGLPPSPLFGAPCFRSSAVLIDWLHAADQGILLHFLASLFKHMLGKLVGSNAKEQCKSLWLELQLYYRANPCSSRLDNLTLSMLGKSGKPPKLRARAAEARFLMPFAVELARRYLSPANAFEDTMLNCTLQLNGCYNNLSAAAFSAQSLREHSRKFAILYVAMETLACDKQKWHVTPKLHLFQELCEETGTCPSLTWTYRDEDMGGTMMQLDRHRGGSNNITASATSTLHRFIAKNRMPAL